MLRTTRQVILAMTCLLLGISGGRDLLYLVSYFFFDLRFLLTRPVGSDPRSEWLRPRWMWGRTGMREVGRLGIGTPIPGPLRSLPEYCQFAAVSGDKVLQTYAEAEARSPNCAETIDGFLVLRRELVADEWGQVRFELLLSSTADLKASLAALPSLPFIAPLAGADGAAVTVHDAGDAIARVYEAEALKTCAGFHDPLLREEAIAATSGTVTQTANGPQVIAMDLEGGKITHAEPVATCDRPERCDLYTIDAGDGLQGCLAWRLSLADPRARDVEGQVRDSASALSWLVGHLHELSALNSRIAEYERAAVGRYVLRDLVRSSVKRRNNQVGAERFGGWCPRDPLVEAARILWASKQLSDDRLQAIRSFTTDGRDAAGVTNHVTQIVNFAELKMTDFSGAHLEGVNLNIDSLLSNVTQTVNLFKQGEQPNKAELAKLLTDLKEELDRVSTAEPARADDAAAVASQTAQLLSTAKEAKPHKGLLKVTMDGLGTLARGLADIAPKVAPIVAAIVTIVAKIHGVAP